MLSKQVEELTEEVEQLLAQYRGLIGAADIKPVARQQRDAPVAG